MEKLYDFKKEKEKILKEKPEIKKIYDDLELKYKLIESVIEYRAENNLTQKELAENIGVKQQVISRFERGLVNPRIDFVQKILNATGKDIEFIDKR
ncbi:helix-turn-helix transcriptional regulator [Geotoga petraea]|jgi:DNA-binding XRE family transcriptional regulator|uniref:Helix-turn-helix n=1 Tax=Geotoga petraea TaxID=28234 RepID=A0A1G6PGX6_9BACT|nr:helix-turn-helix transcriptional regulator [Geotoga petraea]SDC79288.1 Helix-turn-helix [Geotoga petraea]